MVAATLTRRQLLRRFSPVLLGAMGFAAGGPVACGAARGERDQATAHPVSATPPAPEAHQPTSTVGPSATTTRQSGLPAGPAVANEFLVEPIGTVPDGSVEEVLDSLVVARDFYYRELGFYLDGPVTVKVANSPTLPIHALTNRAEGERISAITVNVGSETWVRETALARDRVLAHEYFHVIQEWLHPVPDPELFFLVEGGAEYAANAMMIDAGRMTYHQFRRDMLRRLRVASLKLAPLEDLRAEGAGPLLPKYYIAALAVDFLVAEAGLKQLAEYFALRREAAISEAFAAAFSTPLHSFYASFAVWRTIYGV